MPTRDRAWRWCLHGLLGGSILFLLGAAALCWLAGRFFPYEAIRDMLAAHSNRAGAIFFGADYYAGVIQRGKWAGLALLASAMGLAAIWAWLIRGQTGGLSRGRAMAGLADLGRRSYRALAEDRVAQWILLVAVGLRLLYLFQPICSDEAKAYYAWTARPFLLAISDYRAPQHLLYTVLSYPLVRLLGNAEWVIRLPAFAAGIGLVVLAFLAGRKWFGREAGLFSAIFAAANPLLVHYSVNGRAYTLQTSAVLLLWMAAYGMAGDTRRRWPTLLSAAGVIGLVAVPTTAFALAGTYLWLLAVLVWNAAGNRARQWRGVWRLAACGIATVWLGLLAYLPAYVASDQWYSLDQDLPPGGRIPWNLLWACLTSFAGKAVGIWTSGFSRWETGSLWVLFGIGAFTALRRPAFHLLVANMLGVFLVLVALGVVPYSRTILYQGIGFWVIAGVGAGKVARAFAGGGDAARARRIANGLALCLLAALTALIVFQNRAGFTAVAGDRAPGVRAAMRYLKENARAGDHVVCVAPAAGPVYYYQLRNRTDFRLWLAPDETVPQDVLRSEAAVYLIVHTDRGYSLEYLLRLCRWEAGQPPDMARFERVYSNRQADVYRLLPVP